MELQVYLPVLIATGLFFLVRFVTKRNLFNNNHFVRIRILLGCVYIGYLISEVNRLTR